MSIFLMQEKFADSASSYYLKIFVLNALLK